MPEAAVLARRSGVLRVRILPSHLISLIVLVGGCQNLLLLWFLGKETLLAAGAGILLLGITAAYLPRISTLEGQAHLTFTRLAACIAISALLFLLAGEGRLFYSNLDWQIRDAVLADMIRNPWPFVYMTRGPAEVLRAPIGMYLVPALAGKLGGMAAADLLLLFQNSLFLGALLALGSTLFETTRARLIALAVFLAFSGMDVLGALRFDPAKALDPLSHMEAWAAIQYSSNVTLAFWVPQHALVGWTGAILFLLWQRGTIPLAALAAPLPLLAIWSPLGLMGTLPFALFAYLRTALRRELRLSDVLVPAAATFLVLPSLLYLQSGSGSVGIQFVPLGPRHYLAFQSLEVFPYLIGLWLGGSVVAGARPGLVLASLCLLLFPFVQIGESTDFMMRASIPSLAVVAFLAAEALDRASSGKWWLQRASKLLILGSLIIGAVTPAHEVSRALAFRSTPYPLCNVIGSWQDSVLARTAVGGPVDMATYLAQLSAFPKLLKPEEVAVDRGRDRAPCWERPWSIPR